MRLQVHERLVLLNLWPSQDSYASMKVLRRDREAVDFSPDEIKLYNLRKIHVPGEQPHMEWDAKADAEVVKDVPLDEYTTTVISLKLQEMDRDRKITKDHMSLFAKFVEVYTP